MSIKRIEAGARMSQAVVHGDTVYTAGQVAQNAPGGSVTDQTKDILAAIDRLLAEAGSDKSKLLTANIWLADIADFDEMNAVWDAWVSPGNTPCRACVESKLASPKFTVEIMVTAGVASS
ncbi:MAG: RidA family protein [Alphaproteobacteria bacterium]